MNAFVNNSVAPTARRRALRQAVTLSLAALAMVGLAACGTSTPTVVDDLRHVARRPPPRAA